MSRPRLAFVSAVAQYRALWQMFERTCDLAGADGLVVGGDVEAVPIGHREGWYDSPPPGSPLQLVSLPSGRRLGKVLRLRRILAAFAPDAVLLGPEPHDRDVLATLLALETMRTTRVVSFGMENRVSLPGGLKGSAIRRLWARIDALAAASSSSALSYRLAGFPRTTPFERLVTAVPPPPASSAGRAGGPAGALVAGFVGRLVPEKGVDALLEAVAATPGVSLVVAGAGPLEDAVRRRLQEPDLLGRVDLRGFLSQAQVHGLYEEIDCLVVPSLTVDGWSEQFGAVIAEAMSHGVPSIGSSSGAIPEVVGDSGLIVPENVPAALSVALGVLRDDPVLRARLSAAARRRYSERFSIDRCAATLARMLLSDGRM